MRVSSTAAEAANSNGHQQNSPALEQLRAAIEPDGANADSAATAILEEGESESPEFDPLESFDFEAITAQATAEEAARQAKETGDDLEPFAAAQVEKMQDAIAIPPQPEAPSDPTPAAASPATAPIQSAQPNGVGSSKVDTRPATILYDFTAPAPYDPIAEVEEEIEEIGERIVKHSCKISELDTALKAEKKSWKTASDELVKLCGRKAELLLDQREKEKREAEAATRVFTPIIDPTKPQTDLTKLTYREEGKADTVRVVDPVTTQEIETAAPTATESTEDFHARIDAAFAPTQAQAVPDTPEQRTWDSDFRAVTIESLDGLTPKILEILEANGIRTVGDWQDVPTRRGIEYTQLSGGGAKLTEARFEKVMDAMLAYMQRNPRPEAAVVVASAPAVTVVAAVVQTDTPPTTTIDIDDI